jgi:uncharacterized protein
MKPSISAILIGVRDMDRAKRFYIEGLGWPIQQDAGAYISITRADGSSGIALYRWDALADDCGVPPDGSGFRGITLNYFVRTEAHVDEILADAERAGGTIVKPGAKAQWGGYSGHFADPDGHLWKIVAGGDHPNLSE